MQQLSPQQRELVSSLVERLGTINGMKAVVLGGSQARGRAKPEFDIDLGLFYSDAASFSLDSAAGNFIMLDMGQSRFAFYAHLQPQSLRVRVGDHVHQGQVLALVGNSGNATGPHLHFHVYNANAPLFSEGMPYIFESFAVQVPSPLPARHTNKRRKQRRGTNVVMHRMEMPASEAAVNFPNETRR